METQTATAPPEPDFESEATGGASGRRWAGILAGPAALVLLLALPEPAGLEPAGWRTAAVGLMMALWWMTEALPIAVTALLPLVLFPVLGIAGIQATAAPYANPLIFLFMGGFLIALAMERWNLHRRLALRIIYTIGARPRSIIAGFMLAAAFLSMWISNTATAMMMLPIGLSVVELVRSQARENEGRHFAIVLMLGLAYACSIGGMGTLVGTPTNALLAGFMAEAYGFEVAFADWMLLGAPLMAIALPVIFLILTRLVYPIRLREIPGGKAYITRELRALGTMRGPEKLVTAVFTLTAALWITRPLLEPLIPGLSDTGIAMFSAILLFALPADLKQGAFLLNWSWTKKLPWGVLILFGGGLSLAAAINETGLAAWIGGHVRLLSGWPILGVMAVVVTVIIFLTELTSNTATAAAFLPIVASVAIGLGQNPLLLAIPATLAASCAFMLPVATPPNAIIYGSSFVTIPQMARAGIALNLVFIGIVTLLTYLLLPLVFDVSFGAVPDWALPQ